MRARRRWLLTASTSLRILIRRSRTFAGRCPRAACRGSQCPGKIGPANGGTTRYPWSSRDPASDGSFLAWSLLVVCRSSEKTEGEDPRAQSRALGYPIDLKELKYLVPRRGGEPNSRPLPPCNLGQVFRICRGGSDRLHRGFKICCTSSSAKWFTFGGAKGGKEMRVLPLNMLERETDWPESVRSRVAKRVWMPIPLREPYGAGS